MTISATHAKVLLIGCVVALGIAFGLKIVRYTNPPQRMTNSFDARLTEFLETNHWMRQAPAVNTENKAVQILTFEKTHCAQPLRVSIVGTTSGLESYLRQKFGDDIAFVQHGAVLDHPSLLHYQITNAWNGLVARISGRNPTRQPIIAVTPAPRNKVGNCTGPSSDQWISF